MLCLGPRPDPDIIAHSSSTTHDAVGLPCARALHTPDKESCRVLRRLNPCVWSMTVTNAQHEQQQKGHGKQKLHDQERGETKHMPILRSMLAVVIEEALVDMVPCLCGDKVRSLPGCDGPSSWQLKSPSRYPRQSSCAFQY